MTAGPGPGPMVQELGWDADVDDVRIMFEDAIDGELVEDAVEAVDLVLLWWRDEDGDLVDGLVDALTDLTRHRLHLADDPEGGPRRLRRRRRPGRSGGHRGPGADHERRRLRRLVGDQAGPPPRLAAVSLGPFAGGPRCPSFTPAEPPRPAGLALRDLLRSDGGVLLLSTRGPSRASAPSRAGRAAGRAGALLTPASGAGGVLRPMFSLRAFAERRR